MTDLEVLDENGKLDEKKGILGSRSAATLGQWTHTVYTDIRGAKAVLKPVRSSGGIDWNFSGQPLDTAPVTAYINDAFYDSAATPPKKNLVTLKSAEDWHSLRYNFRASAQFYAGWTGKGSHGEHPAGFSGVTEELTEEEANALAGVPEIVTVAAGSTTATFPVVTSPLPPSNTPVTIYAATWGDGLAAELVLSPAKAAADLAVEMTAAAAAPKVGSPLTYTITATNHGPDPIDFGPWGGSIVFNMNPSVRFHFGETTEALEPHEADFFTTALHEIAHVLGIGTADSWQTFVDGTLGVFTGPASVAEYDGTGGVHLNAKLDHWEEGMIDEGESTLMGPVMPDGARKLMTALDWAGLEDVGWSIDGLLHEESVVSYYEDDGKVTFDAGPLGPGDSATFTVQVTPLVEGAITNVVDVTSEYVDDPDNNTSEFSLAVARIVGELDFGDAPDPTYPTLVNSDGARHVIVPGFHLGWGVDADTDDPATTEQARPVVIDVAANDSDPDGNLDPLSVVFLGQPAHRSAFLDRTTGLVTYVPHPDTVGGDWFDYRIRDSQGLPDTATVLVDVFRGNTPPIARDDSETTGEDTPVVIDVLANDSDPATVRITVNPRYFGFGSISGYVYFDADGDGVKDAEEIGLPGIPVAITGPVTLDTVTGADGWYDFAELPPGVYTLSEKVQPGAFRDGVDTPGTPQLGTVGDDRFVGLELTADTHAVDYNFGEGCLIPELISKRLFLASTPPMDELVLDFSLADRDVWLGFQASENGLVTAELIGDNVTDRRIELYAENWIPLAIVADATRLEAAVVEGKSYVLHASGASADVNLILSNPLKQGGTREVIVGTDGDDRFEFIPAATPGHCTVKVNGLEHDVDPSVTTIHFDG